MAQPLKIDMFSFVLSQHQRMLDWLEEQPYVDPAIIGFYGMSYGGKTAIRVPPLPDGYALSICSGDFNEIVWAMTSVIENSFVFNDSWDLYEFNFANVVDYSDLACLMLPRPFMAERGHSDGVLDEHAGFEFATVQRFYDKFGIRVSAQVSLPPGIVRRGRLNPPMVDESSRSTLEICWHPR